MFLYPQQHSIQITMVLLPLKPLFLILFKNVEYRGNMFVDTLNTTHGKVSKTLYTEQRIINTKKHSGN